MSHLSRTISHALRHQPWVYELELDDEGWVDLETLLRSLREQRPEWRTLAEHDVARMMASADKQRFELCEGRIRALYGHSTAKRLQKEPAEPPAHLFHGTSPDASDAILREGLRPMGRQYVHLSADVETAHAVGRRKSSRPVILEVDAVSAFAAGVAFYLGNERVWLADSVPATFVRFPADRGAPST